MNSVSVIAPKLNPQKLHSNTVIKAIKSHKAKTSREFSFEVDDCFYLVGGASEAREYLEVIQPRSRLPGLVPAQKFEFVRATTLNNIPKSQRITKNVLAYVTQNYYRIASYDLQANKGDPVLILEDLCESFYLAKLIGKVDSPGRIPKTHVELKDDIAQRTTSCVDAKQLLSNQSRALRKNNSLGNVVRTEKNKAIVSRRTESVPNSQSSLSSCNPFSSWGILNSELNLGSLDTSEDIPSEASVILDTVPISHINVIRGLEHQGYSLVELEVHLCDSSRRTIFRPSSCFKKLQLSLLESFPKESGLTGQSRTMPYMPTLNQTSSEPQLSEKEVLDFNDFFRELLEVNGLLPRCCALLDFIKTQPQDKELAHRATCLNRNTGKGHFKTSSGQISKLGLQVNKLFRNPESTPSKPAPDAFLSQSNRESFSTISSQSTTPSSRNSHFSTKDLPALPPLASSNQSIKVKLQYHSDMMAFILPSASLSFPSLVAKITSRIGHPPNSIAHHDPASPNQRRRFITGPKDLDSVLQSCSSKLWLIVD